MKQLIILLLFVSASNGLLGQQYYDDARLWGFLNVEKKLNDKFSLHLKHKSRWDNNVTRYELGYVTLGLSYSPKKFIRIQGNYSYAAKHKNTGRFANRHTYSLAVYLKHNYKRFHFLYRNMLLVRYTNPNSDNFGYIPLIYDKNKVVVRYEATKRFDFYVAEEVRLSLMGGTPVGLNRSRAYAGMLIKTTKNQSLELYFALQHQFLKSDWYNQKNKYPNQPLNRDYIYGIGYNIEF